MEVGLARVVGWGSDREARASVRCVAVLDRADCLRDSVGSHVLRLLDARADRALGLTGCLTNRRLLHDVLVEAAKLLVALLACLCPQHVTGAEADHHPEPSSHGYLQSWL